MSKMTLIGLALVKSVFQVHGVDAEGTVVLKQRLTRAQRTVFFAQQDPCVVAMEACGSAHHWARQLASLGHPPQLLSPQYVKPFVRTTKHAAAEAEASATAARQPGMPTVVIKTPEQPAVLAIHRVRDGLVKSGTATCHPIRGCLAEFGGVLPVGVSQLDSRLPGIVEEGENERPALLRQRLQRLCDHRKHLRPEIEPCEALIASWHRQNNASQRLTALLVLDQS